MPSVCDRSASEVRAGTLTHVSLIGESPVFRAAVRMMQRIAKNDATVLVQGEIGTGKELAARAIHGFGPRRDGPFIPVNCGTVRDVGAGPIAAADGGTLFLDEVEALSPAGQVALLRFLQGRRRPI